MTETTEAIEMTETKDKGDKKGPKEEEMRAEEIENPEITIEITIEKKEGRGNSLKNPEMMEEYKKREEIESL